ncbi:DUF4355 domain-containing protein [Lederbergia citri]|uniref:DUF4355 domain-containing protein n=1 Tax=Lederbergia citri TaxID=2833580 RepID=A0A942TCR5_9BACI|nr:DUF4355 domain-containing protein [Lederbergia citri]MBS4195338.1 DUF4355 domain-containing protein [Lederbergia citri]
MSIENQNVNENPTVEEPEKTESPSNKPEEKTFTQAELDKIIADRLAREQKKRDEAIQKERDEAERKRLEEAQQYKELAEKYREELESQKADVLKAKKDAMLAKAGYTDEQIGVLRNTIAGETDEELTQAIEGLKAVIAPKPKYVDPSPMNGERGKPEPVDGTELGKSMYAKIKHKIRG